MSVELAQLETRMVEMAQPRIERGMPAEAYHAHPALSASKLKAMRKSPAHCRYQLDHPKTTEAMALGAMVHTILLEPLTFSDRYFVMPKCDRRTKEGKQRHEEATREACGKTVVEQADLDTASMMARAVADHASFPALLRNFGHNELSVFWRDDDTGLECKMRADRLVEVPGFGLVCVDLKTTTDASPEGFARAVNKFGYHIQAAFYLEGLARAGMSCERFVIIAVESDAPHCVAAYALDDDAMEQGRREVERLKRVYAECLRTGVWPAYSDRIESLSLPKWAINTEL